MRNSKKTTVRSYANNQLVKAYVDKSVKYKGYMPKYKVNQVVEESEGDSFDFNPQLHSWVKETQEGNFLLVNKLPNGKLKAWYVTQTYNVLRGVIDAELEIEFSDSWESYWEIIPKVNIQGKFRVSKLKCPRGLSMARFKNHCSVPSDSFLESYFANGGCVDGGGWSEPVWGFYPSSLASFEEIGIDPSLLGRVFAVIGRVDYGHYDSILEMVSLGLEPRNRKEYGRNCYGISRRNLLEKFGVSHNKGVITLGYMSQIAFLKMLFKGATSFNREWYWDGGFGSINDKILKKVLPYCNKVTRTYIVSFIKYQRRQDLQNRCYTTNTTMANLCSKKAVEYVIKKGYDIPRRQILSRNRVDSKRELTTIGDVKYFANEYDFSLEGKLFKEIHYRGISYVGGADLIQARRIAGYWVAKVKSISGSKETTFLWENSFSDHFEAQSLREGLEMIQKRAKKASLILCLNDVRNDRTGTAGYCLAGTKSFAQARMPFLYRLISQYYEWKDIPSEIMELEFHLASKEIFNGFRNPVS